MADNDQENDEYKFAELDPIDNDSMNDADSDYLKENKNDASSTESKPESQNKPDIRRNGMLVIGLIIFIMILYKLIGYLFFSENKENLANEPSITALKQVQATEPVQTLVPVNSEPVQKLQQLQSSITEAEQELAKKVSSMEQSEQNMRAELSTLSDQIGTINNNINNLNTQVANLNQIIGNLSNQLANQTESMSKLIVKPQPRRVIRLPHYGTPRLTYYIEAVIPGRAWLIASNGSTITVREGTRIAGYGVVKLIDSLQGRILMSSGQVIKFSQEDS